MVLYCLSIVLDNSFVLYFLISKNFMNSKNQRKSFIVFVLCESALFNTNYVTLVVMNVFLLIG